MRKNRTVICLTASYPYGKRETYFESELQYLADAFERVIIIPKYNPYNENGNRNIPHNVQVVPPVLPMNKGVRFFKGVFSAGPIDLYITDFFDNKVYRSISFIKSWFQSLLMHRIIYKRFKDVLEEIDGEIIIYSYWADAPIIGTRLLKKYIKVVRMHRWDFYVEEHNGYLPVRKKIYESSDILLPISLDIKERLIKDYNVNNDKIYLSYLGVSAVESKEDVFSKPNDGILRIVSCSRVDPIKRVELIAEAVLMLGSEQTVEWHHFGDGLDFESLKAKLDQVPEHITIQLHGWKEQQDLYNFYRENYVTWFVNVSRHEGVPVSIMEAISFAIPAIATDVGATRELINEGNGFLVCEEITSNELLNLILSYKEPSYIIKRGQAYQTWLDKFNADKNYKQLVQQLAKM